MPSLANTTWLFKMNIGIVSTNEYNVNFESNNNSYTKMQMGSEYGTLNYNSTLVYYEGWNQEGYKTVKFTGGDDISNSNLITFMQNNAVKLSLGLDLSGRSWWSALSTGSHSVKIKARASGYYDSLYSDPVTVTKVVETMYTITVNVINGSYTGPSNIQSGGTASIIINADTQNYCYVPKIIKVVGADYYWGITDKVSGTIILSNPVSNITITVVCLDSYGMEIGTSMRKLGASSWYNSLKFLTSDVSLFFDHKVTFSNGLAVAETSEFTLLYSFPGIDNEYLVDGDQTEFVYEQNSLGFRLSDFFTITGMSTFVESGTRYYQVTFTRTATESQIRAYIDIAVNMGDTAPVFSLYLPDFVVSQNTVNRYSIQVTATDTGENYYSPYSSVRNVTVEQQFNITSSIVNGSVVGAQSITSYESVTLRIEPDNNYKCPEFIGVSNTTLRSYDKSTGELVIDSPTNTVLLSCTCPVVYLGLGSEFSLDNSTWVSALPAFNSSSSTYDFYWKLTISNTYSLLQLEEFCIVFSNMDTTKVDNFYLTNLDPAMFTYLNNAAGHALNEFFDPISVVQVSASSWRVKFKRKNIASYILKNWILAAQNNPANWDFSIVGNGWEVTGRTAFTQDILATLNDDSVYMIGSSVGSIKYS